MRTKLVEWLAVGVILVGQMVTLVAVFATMRSDIRHQEQTDALHAASIQAISSTQQETASILANVAARLQTLENRQDRTETRVDAIYGPMRGDQRP